MPLSQFYATQMKSRVRSARIKSDMWKCRRGSGRAGRAMRQGARNYRLSISEGGHIRPSLRQCATAGMPNPEGLREVETQSKSAWAERLRRGQKSALAERLSIGNQQLAAKRKKRK